jgi:hypothetical protein
MGIALIDMKMDREFKKRNTVKGVEDRTEALNRLGLEPEKVHVPKYVKKGNNVYKVVDGNLVPLKPVEK